MKNDIQIGDVLTLVAPATVTGGSGILVGNVFGVVVSDVISGANVETAVEGVFTLPKAAGAIAQGARVYWDNSAMNVTTTSSGNTLIGVATVAALSGDITAIIRLNGSF